MKFKSFLQLLIFCVIILSSYLIYNNFFSKQTYVEEIDIKKEELELKTSNIIENEKENLILDLEYKSIDNLGNEYFIKAETAESSIENLDLLKLTNVTAVVSLTNKPEIYITSNFANHNKKNFDTEFYGNVRIKHEDIRVNSENLDLLYDENLVSLYNIHEAFNSKTRLTADKINFDILTRDLKIFMYKQNERIQVIKK